MLLFGRPKRSKEPAPASQGGRGTGAETSGNSRSEDHSPPNCTLNESRRGYGPMMRVSDARVSESYPQHPRKREQHNTYAENHNINIRALFFSHAKMDGLAHCRQRDDGVVTDVRARVALALLSLVVEVWRMRRATNRSVVGKQETQKANNGRVPEAAARGDWKQLHTHIAVCWPLRYAPAACS
ncbi:hypothetical protein HPB50_016029 [Hyalomma asiaticum]|uniref:Uncharacterized protein n=1 Tax=Hyalomma asiaticum TaxID=266040 RepID=A0ACB7T8F3_HYAAI|nr:hypothetical protein HPB50_016029 [Hyalomma asiaticum]